MSLKSTCRTLSFVGLFIFPFLSWADNERCIRAINDFLAKPRENSPLSHSEGHRLASLIRSQSENILNSETTGATNIKWNGSLNSFFSTYTSANGNQVDLIYTPEGLVESYRLKLKGAVTYHCNIVREKRKRSKKVQ